MTAGAAPPTPRVRARRRAGGEHDDVSLGRLRRQEPGSVERDEVRVERVDRAAAGAFSAAAKSTRPAGRGNSRNSPSCDDSCGTNAGSIPCARNASAVPGPTAAIAGRLRPRAAISSAPFGLVTISQS